jgi:hypothetical protein
MCLGFCPYLLISKRVWVKRKGAVAGLGDKWKAFRFGAAFSLPGILRARRSGEK